MRVADRIKDRKARKDRKFDLELGGKIRELPEIFTFRLSGEN